MRILCASFVVGIASTALAPVFAQVCGDETPCRCAPQLNLADSDPSGCEVVAPRGHEWQESLAKECELLRAALQTKWLGGKNTNWQPRCIVVLHADRKNYLAAVGRGGLMTYGSSRVTFSNDRIVGRRIDLCGDDTGRAKSALAHEMCHIVLADHFGKQGLPRWADEGIAVLEDVNAKQAQHHEDLESAMNQGRCPPLTDLLMMDLPRDDRVPVFYGQSASFARFLASRKSPSDIPKFVKVALKVGYDQAAKEIYGYSDFRALEREWKIDIALQSAKFGASVKAVTHLEQATTVKLARTARNQ